MHGALRVNEVSHSVSTVLNESAFQKSGMKWVLFRNVRKQSRFVATDTAGATT